jgi:Iron-containing redox enzyme
MNGIERYEEQLLPARRRFAGRSGLGAALDSSLEPKRLHALLLHFCALGYQMTIDVENWIRRAGERCEVLGYDELGRALLAHARHEAGHEKLFASDARALVDMWNRRWSPPFDAEALLEQRPTAGVRLYRELHEDIIESPMPFRQIAIEFEIEAVSVREGSRLLHAVYDKLGVEAVEVLSFVKEHVEVDEGHTKFNEKQLDRFLAANPDALPDLVGAGVRALDAYGAFLDDCNEMTRDDAR